MLLPQRVGSPLTMAASLYVAYHQNRANVAADAAVLVDFDTTEAFYAATSTVNGLWTVHGGAAHAGIKVRACTRARLSSLSRHSRHRPVSPPV